MDTPSSPLPHGQARLKQAAAHVLDLAVQGIWIPAHTYCLAEIGPQVIYFCSQKQ